MLPSQPQMPPFAPELPPPHPVYGKVLNLIINFEMNLWFHVYEDGTRVGMAVDPEYP